MKKLYLVACLTTINILLACTLPLNVLGGESCFPTITSDLQLHIPVLRINADMYSIDLAYREQGPGDGIWFELTGGKQTTADNCSNPPALFMDKDRTIINFPILNCLGQPLWTAMQLVSHQEGLWLKVVNYGPLPKRAFLTSVAGTGDLSSWPDAQGKTDIEAGDAICQARAEAAGLSGTFTAWLSDTTSDAYCRIHNLSGKKQDNCGQPALPADAGPWVRTDGFPFASDASHLFGEGKIYSTITTDEFGKHPEIYWYFTGTRADGTLYKKQDGAPCNNWSSNQDVFVSGSVSSFGSWSWSSGTSNSCSDQNALLCIESGHGPAISNVIIPGKKVFLSSLKGTGNLSSWDGADGNTGIAAGDSICRTLARNAGLENADHFKAWLSDSHTSAIDRIQSDGPWVRVDGILVAENRQGLAEGGLLTVIDVTENEKHINEMYAWTGTLNNRMPDTENICGDWQVGSDGSNGRIGRIFDISAWTTGGYPSCSNIYHLYCLED